MTQSRPPKELFQIVQLIEKLPKRYKAAFVCADIKDPEGGLFLSFSCCRACAIHSMELAQIGLAVEVEMEQDRSTNHWVQ
jgi:hypothetical protein